MVLMRTEFFETLNPRGRKLTTRLQERWPLDRERERYEAAAATRRLAGGAHRAAERAANAHACGHKHEREHEHGHGHVHADAHAHAHAHMT